MPVDATGPIYQPTCCLGLHLGQPQMKVASRGLTVLEDLGEAMS